jgi:hypothetical protein
MIKSNPHIQVDVQHLAKHAAKFISWNYSAFADFFAKQGKVEAAANNKKSASFWWSVSDWDSVPQRFIEQQELKLHYWLVKWEARLTQLNELLRVTQRETLKPDIVALEIKIEDAKVLVYSLSAAVEADASASNSPIDFQHYEGPESRPYTPPEGVTRGTHEEADENDAKSGPLFS